MGQLGTVIAQKAKLYALLSIEMELSSAREEINRTKAEMTREDIQDVENMIQELVAAERNN